MGLTTKIEYCDSTINPIMGCTGCELSPNHCYANRLCARYAGRKGWPKRFNRPEHFPGRIEKALRWSDLTGMDRPDKPWLNSYPRIIFVNDMSDGFCPTVNPREWLLPHIPAMHLSPHILLLMTKWPDRMASFFYDWGYPIPSNFWLGTTVTSQDTTWRIEELLRIQGATVRFVSLEPMLGAIDLLTIRDPNWATSLTWTTGQPMGTTNALNQLNWIIVGGETVPGARPMHPDWARQVRDDCVAAGTPYFFKQWGAWSPNSDFVTTSAPRQLVSAFGLLGIKDKLMDRVGKKRAGRLLDGRTWNEMPGRDR